MKALTIKITNQAKYNHFTAILEEELLTENNYSVQVDATITIDEDEIVIAKLHFEPETADAYQYMLEVLSLCDAGATYGLTVIITNLTEEFSMKKQQVQATLEQLHWTFEHPGVWIKTLPSGMTYGINNETFCVYDSLELYYECIPQHTWDIADLAKWPCSGNIAVEINLASQYFSCTDDMNPDNLAYQQILDKMLDHTAEIVKLAQQAWEFEPGVKPLTDCISVLLTELN